VKFFLHTHIHSATPIR